LPSILVISALPSKLARQHHQHYQIIIASKNHHHLHSIFSRTRVLDPQVLVDNIKDKVLESLESDKRAKQMTESYMMGSALNPHSGDESNQTDVFKPRFSTWQFCNQMLCNIDSNETDEALLYSGCLHGCIGVLKGAADASLKQVHRGQALHTCDDYCDGVARSPALSPKLYELLNGTQSRSIWVGSCLQSCGRALTVREGGNIKLPEENAGITGGNQSAPGTLSGSKEGNQPSLVPCETSSPFVRCRVTPIKPNGSGVKLKRSFPRIT